MLFLESRHIHILNHANETKFYRTNLYQRDKQKYSIPVPGVAGANGEGAPGVIGL